MRAKDPVAPDKTTLGVLYAFSFLRNLLFFGAVAVPFYRHRVGLDYTRMFMLEAIFSASLFAFEIPTGVVADRFGRKKSLALGSLLFGLGFLAFGFSVDYAILLAAEVVAALGMSMMSGADRALLYETIRAAGRNDDATAIMARHDAFGTVGLFVSLIAGPLFVSSGLVPYRDALGQTFLATAAVLIAGALVILFAREGHRTPRGGSALRAGVDGFRYIFRVPALTRFSLNYAIVSALTFFMFWFYQSLLMDNGLPLALQGFVAAGFNLAATGLLLIAGRVDRALGTSRTLALSSAVPGLCYLLIAFVPGLPAALVAIFGVATLKLFRAPILSFLMNERIEDDDRATVLSGVSMLERLITMAFYPIVGILMDSSPRLTYALMGILTLFATAFVRVDDRHLMGQPTATSE